MMLLQYENQNYCTFLLSKIWLHLACYKFLKLMENSQAQKKSGMIRNPYFDNHKKYFCTTKNRKYGLFEMQMSARKISFSPFNNHSIIAHTTKINKPPSRRHHVCSITNYTTAECEKIYNLLLEIFVTKNIFIFF